MTIKELRKRKDYEFDCYYNKRKAMKETEMYEVCDIWGFAELIVGDIGVEYNFCIDDGTNEAINSSAIYEMEYNKNEDCWETNYNNYIHYEIDFNNKNWKKELENAMCKALIEFSEYKIKIKSFIDNLTDDDIDLIDKLDNLNGHAQISSYAYALMKEEDNFESANEYIKEILWGEAQEDLTEEYIEFIIEETKNMYEQGFCEKDDFSTGLYNCDELYLLVIADVLDCDFDDLEDLEEDYGRLTI